MPALSRADLELVELLDTAPSISAIARELGRTQPAVSTRLAALERRHGGPLVARYAHGITPESPALELARLARRALLAIDTAEDRLTGFDVAAVRERTTVAASLTIAEHLLSGWLSSVPGSADVDIVVANSLDVVRNVRAGSAHIGFIEGAHAPTDLVSWEIGHDELAVIAPASHRGGRLTGTDLLREPLVVRESGSGTRDVLERALAGEGLRLPDGLPHVNSAAAIVQAVRHGSVAVVPRLSVAPALADGRFIELQTSLRLHRTLRMITSPATSPTDASRRLARTVRAVGLDSSHGSI